MSRRARPEGFGERMTALSKALGRRGDETTMRGFAKELTMSPQGYRYWEKPGSYPGHTKLANALANVAGVQSRKLDPSRLAIWLETGQGEAPWLAPASAPTPGPHALSSSTPSSGVDLKSVGGDLDHRTPWRLIITLNDLVRSGRQDEAKAVLGMAAPVAETVLKNDPGQQKAP